MGQLQDAFRDAAGEVANIKAHPSNRYWWLYGTIKAKNENGTLDVAIDGVTIQQVKATVSCMMANVGDRVVVLKAGPIMTCIDVISGSVQGTAYNTRNWLRLSSTPLTLVDEVVHNDTGKTRYFVIGHSQLSTTSPNASGSIRAAGSIGGLGGAYRCEFDVTVSTKSPVKVDVSHLTVPEKTGISLRQSKDGRVWLYAWMSYEWCYAKIAAKADRTNEADGFWQDSPPNGDIIWSGDTAAGNSLSPELFSGMSIGRGLEASGKTLSADKSDLRKMLFSGDRVSTDLDSATPGIWEYNTDTKNGPTQWGVCLVLWSEEDAAASSDWKFQLALPTGGDPKWRRNINRTGWSNWWTMHTD